MSTNSSICTHATNSSTLAAGGFGRSFSLGLTFLYVVIVVTSVVGYGVITVTVCLNRRLRTICNYFIVSLGAADVVIVTMVMPINIGFLLQTFHFTTAAQCNFISTVNLISISAVSLNLCAVSLERFFAIAYPFKHEAFTTTKTTAILIGSVWFYAISAALLPMMGWHSQPRAVYRGMCVPDNVESYTVFMTIGSFFVPAVVMVASNFIVYRIATNQSKRIFRILPVVGPGAELLRKNYRAAKRISLIVGAYLVCWVPQMVVLVVGLFIGARRIPIVVYPVTLSLQYSCSAVNPCLFAFTNRELRKTIKKVVKKVFGTKKPATNSATEIGLTERRRSIMCRISQTTELSIGSRGGERANERYRH